MGLSCAGVRCQGCLSLQELGWSRLSVFALFLCLSFQPSQAASPDKAALLAVKGALVDTTGLALRSWTNDSDPCPSSGGFSGISCNDAERVTSIDLTSRRLGGTLSPQIGSLIALVSIQLSRNSIGGSLPAELGLLKNLTALYAAQNNFTGSLPKELGNLPRLSEVQLRENALTGTIPASFSNLTALTTVDLANNSLTGSVPFALIRPGITYDLTGTSLCSSAPATGIPLCGAPSFAPSNPAPGSTSASPSTPTPGSTSAPVGAISDNSTGSRTPTDTGDGGSSNTGAIVGAVVAVIAGIAIIGVLGFLYKRQKGRKSAADPTLPLHKAGSAGSPGVNGSNAFPVPHNEPPSAANSSVQGGMHPYSAGTTSSVSSTTPPPSTPVGVVWLTLGQLSTATGGFSTANLLGQGGFGKVYKGRLEDGSEVAVKQLVGGGQGEREFRAEVDNLSRIQHRHLVKLRACAAQGEERALVYDLAPNGTLEQHLHNRQQGDPLLDWPKRIKIAIGAAKGLAYLHEDVEPRIVHRDVKGSNILLDANFNARVSDFGLARMFDEKQSHVSTRVMGTFGYLAPEYFSTAQLSPASDTYSFGVVLLELITGRKPMDFTGSPPNSNLVEYAQNVINGDRALELLDPELQGAVPAEELLSVISVAAQCVQKDPTKRPRMSQVARMLETPNETWSHIKLGGGAHVEFANLQQGQLKAGAGTGSSFEADSMGLLSTHSTMFSEDSMAGVTVAFPERFDQAR